MSLPCWTQPQNQIPVMSRHWFGICDWNGHFCHWHCHWGRTDSVGAIQRKSCVIWCCVWYRGYICQSFNQGVGVSICQGVYKTMTVGSKWWGHEWLGGYERPMRDTWIGRTNIGVHLLEIRSHEEIPEGPVSDCVRRKLQNDHQDFGKGCHTWYLKSLWLTTRIE